MNSILARFTPASLVRLARLLALLTTIVMMIGYAGNLLTIETAGMGAFGLSVLLLLAVPDQRASELLGAVAIWMTTAEFMSAAETGYFNHWRWAVAVATLALVTVPLKVQYLRLLARTVPDAPIGDLDRRAWSAGSLPHSAAALATLRGESHDEAAERQVSGTTQMA
ncbi:hypothetical protein OLX02_00880 [Novosphingobium sp. KCTC 2891]|uniref:hypothetical protein n=1 Tax=Novosphingobium sp. KCTC 2891 TaxID=2989730 RepID=UPI002222DAC5|nr:hypothetical protein [Novosphingobium sp. KCTC 2891]MCW1381365.1 hypothetical protein [Novosphingobium sp. KCTC 2891]